ncbi:MAG TPA: leucyl aminopeptidase [Acidobacteriota bacterium]|nr:leucyl aminopeptidase [Acidobacteriota bacterium]
MKVNLVNSTLDSVECDALIVPVFEDDDFNQPPVSRLEGLWGGLLKEMADSGEWKGKTGQQVTIHRPAGIKARRVVVAGAGKRANFDSAAVRQLMMSVAHRLKDKELQRIAAYRRSQIPLESAVQSAVEGLLLGAWQIDEYKTESRARGPAEVQLVMEEEITTESEKALGRGEIMGRATNLARCLANEPGNRLNPTLLATKAQEIGEKYDLEVEVFDERDMEERGMNCLLAVARGSDEPARFIVLRHLAVPPSDQPPLVYIGKGVTFDSGGLSLKSPQSMEDMKLDKAGACAVLAALQAIAQLQAPVNVVGLIPAVENLPSGRAQKPGDIIRSMSGKTIEVVNTDAEGRLILADALHYARSLNPHLIVDLATLTGACVVALGQFRAGLFCNNEELYQRFLAAAARSGEKFWRLPLDDDYRKELESRIADIKNVGSKWGGAITAAKFLQEFVGDTPWCHIDMAGVDSFPDGDELKGPTGFGTRTLVELAL